VSARIDPSWTVLDSVENTEHDRCVDLFRRADGSFGFEEFRRDVEDGGLWTPVAWYADAEYPTLEAARLAARGAVGWLAAEWLAAG